MKKTLCLVGLQDGLEFSQVVEKAFASAKGFSARPEAAKFLAADEFYPVLGLRHDGKLVSVMRLEWVLSYDEIAFKIKGFPKNIEVRFPAVYLTKAGTLPHLHNQGLNMTLRYFAFKIARNWGAQQVFGTIVEGSPRIGSMVKMGYDFTKLNTMWEGLYVSHGDPLLASIDLTKEREKAFSFLEKQTAEYRKDLQIEFDLKSVQIKSDCPFKWPKAV